MITFLILGMACGIACGIAALLVERAIHKWTLYVGYGSVLSLAFIAGHALAFGLGLVLGPVVFVVTGVLIAAWAFSGMQL